MATVKTQYDNYLTNHRKEQKLKMLNSKRDVIWLNQKNKESKFSFAFKQLRFILRANVTPGNFASNPLNME